MLRRLAALVGILLMLCTLASLIWVVYLHRVHATTTEPDDTVEVISQLFPPSSHLYMEESLNV